MSRLARWGLVIGVLLLGLLAWWLWNLEWVELESGREPTEQARREPYLAAVRFLEGLGVTVQQEQGLSRLDGKLEAPLPSTDDVILLIDTFGILSRSRAERLRQWVNEGGRVILGARNPYVSDRELEQDALFDLYGVTVQRGIDAHLDDEEVPRTIRDLLAPNDPCSRLLTPFRFRFANDSQDIQVAFPDWLTLETENDAVTAGLEDSLGPRLLQFEEGAGHITFLTSTELWTNPYIGCHDNAYMLAQLAVTDGKVWLLVNQEAPSLLQLLWQRAWLWLLALLLWVALFLWRRAVRFGPIIQMPSEHRRRLLEHIEAGAGFLWRHRQREGLIAPLREQVWARAKQRLGHQGDSPAGLYKALAQLTDIPVASVERALAGPVTDEAAFIRAVSNLKTMKERL